MIEVIGLTYSYPGSQPLTFPDISCNKGNTHLILGKSGCGKTTLLHLMAGLLKPESGIVEIAGSDISQLSGAGLDKFRGKKIGIVFQQPHFLEALTVQENLILAQKLAGEKTDQGKVNQLLDHLGIGSKKDKKPSELSAGEQQRAAIARALVNSPELLLADEPTSALDDENCNAVVKILSELAIENNSALVIVTHDTRLKNIFPNQTILA
ncbi:MAG: ABC transporter ATP-binding protein [Saprospirales bacterium]|nr:MAG: ABC transporter ATP-binding protein [Saprospirales bacterium]